MQGWCELGGHLCPYTVNLISLLVQNMPSISGVNREARVESGNGLECSQGQGLPSLNEQILYLLWLEASIFPVL